MLLSILTLGCKPKPEPDYLPHVSEDDPGLGRCGKCRRTWKRVQGHTTSYEESHACFPLCEECWSSLTPATRLPYYQALMANWLAQFSGYRPFSFANDTADYMKFGADATFEEPKYFDDAIAKWPLIRQAVLDGK